MRPGYCETKEEYNMSKTLLVTYLYSKEAKQILLEHPTTVTLIVNFIRTRTRTRKNSRRRRRYRNRRRDKE